MVNMIVIEIVYYELFLDQSTMSGEKWGKSALNMWQDHGRPRGMREKKWWGPLQLATSYKENNRIK